MTNATTRFHRITQLQSVPVNLTRGHLPGPPTFLDAEEVRGFKSSSAHHQRPWSQGLFLSAAPAGSVARSRKVDEKLTRRVGDELSLSGGLGMSSEAG